MKKYLPILVLSAFVLAACGPTASVTTNPTSSNSTQSPPTTAPQTASQTLRQLISLGLTQKCTWTSTDDQGQPTSGDILIKGQQFKQTSQVTVNGQAMNSTMISDGTYFYTWTDSTKANGIKMAIPTPGAAASPAADKNLDKQINYSCSPVAASDADFAIPSDVTFTDLSKTLDSLKKLNIDDLKKQYGGQ